MTTTEIREALLAIEQAVDVPPADQVAFQARVRAERRRRNAGRTLIGVAAAAAVVTAGIVGNAVLDEPTSTPLANTPGETEVTGVGDTVFFVLDGQLTALDPRGVVHDLGQHSEGVIGWTKDRVYALDDDSHITVRRTEPPFDVVPGAPTPDPVQSVALSGDGRYLAWLGNDNMVHRYDLKADREDLEFQVFDNASIAGVADGGVLVADAGGLSLRDANGEVPIPVANGGDGWASDVARDLVTVTAAPEASRLYDLSEGSAQLVDTFAGSAVLGPYAERVAVIVPEPADRARVEVWDGGTLTPVTGLDDIIPTAVRWADETTLLVTGRDALYACDIELRCGQLPVEGDVGLNE